MQGRAEGEIEVKFVRGHGPRQSSPEHPVEMHFLLEPIGLSRLGLACDSEPRSGTNGTNWLFSSKRRGSARALCKATIKEPSSDNAAIM